MIQNEKVKRAIAVSGAVMLLQLAGIAAARAQDEYDNWIARGHLVHVWPGSDSVRFENPPGETPPVFNQFWTDGGNGFNGEIEYLFRPNLGLWGGLTFANMKTNLRFDQGPLSAVSDDRVDMRQLNLGGNYHFTPDGRFDIYAGVLVSWVGYSSSTFNFSRVDRDYRVEYDSELAWGINGGFDIPFGRESSWFASIELRYLLLALEGDSNFQHLTVDPVQGYFGVGYSWW